MGEDASGILHRSPCPFTLEVITIQDGVECTLGLRQDVEGVGGEPKITAKFPEGTVEITQFEALKKAAAGKD